MDESMVAAQQDFSASVWRPPSQGLFFFSFFFLWVLHNWTSSSWRSNRKWHNVISFRQTRAETEGAVLRTVADWTSAVVCLQQPHTLSHTHTAHSDEWWPRLSPPNTAKLWPRVPLVARQRSFPPRGRSHSSGCYLRHCCSAAVVRGSNSPLFLHTVCRRRCRRREITCPVFELRKWQSPFIGERFLFFVTFARHTGAVFGFWEPTISWRSWARHFIHVFSWQTCSTSKLNQTLRSVLGDVDFLKWVSVI